MSTVSPMCRAVAWGLALLVAGAVHAAPATPTPLPLGAPIPHFTARQLAPGTAATWSTRDLQPRPLVVSFVASYCKPCRVEVPHLVRLAAAHPSWQVVLVVLDRDPAGLAAAQRWLLEESAVKLPVVRDRFSLIGRRFGVQVLPHMAAFDAAGRLVWQGVGAETAELGPMVDALTVPSP